MDYALRFELGRRCPHALEESWVAHGALGVLPGEFITETGTSSPWELGARILQDAERVVRAYRRLTKVGAKDLQAMAKAALSLSALDLLCRAPFNPYTWNEDFARVERGEVDEVRRMIEHAPLDEFTTSGTMLLNPTFGRNSRAVGGADADLIVDGTLFEIKTTQEAKVTLEHLRQLCGYFLLARAMRQDEPRFPVISNLGIYFPRYGYTWRFPAQVLISHPVFAETEDWFFQQVLRRRGLPVETLEMRSVRDWLKSRPRQFGPRPDSISSPLPQEELHGILINRFENKRPRAARTRTGVRKRSLKKTR
ncbi:MULTISPECIES: hypothetical protein [unclassified Corallococcus]|uniref:hypothetical protein n=1 Tax=unclassified Corallococcus TaxID=2685029 RepID=UPI001A8EC717|nr:MULTISPECIES: hypothetical protein [unclassified Corallococcus]MBN9686951.1 hypothetical protein [Corallococcus sp. NCSPR001]WAS89218.1 hypothetical protein O0N60_20090 [Corallococcus sp. NCRR]